MCKTSNKDFLFLTGAEEADNKMKSAVEEKQTLQNENDRLSELLKSSVCCHYIQSYNAVELFYTHRGYEAAFHFKIIFDYLS